MATHRFCLTLFPVLLLMQTVPAQAQWFTEIQTEALHGDNLSRSERSGDAREDSSVSAGVRAGLHTQPGIHTGLTLRGRLGQHR